MARGLPCLAVVVLVLLLGSSEAKTASPKAKAKPQGGPTCRDPDGKSVDWWAAIKLPRFKASDAGDDYVYIDSTYSPPDAAQEGPAGSLKWTPGHGLGDANTGPLAQTMLPLYSESDGQALESDAQHAAFGMLAYNDEYPESLSADPALKVPSFWPGGAHAKGVLGLGETQGFWLVHSMPQYPGTLEEGYFGIGPHQLKFGQSLLCISLAAAQLDTVGKALQTSGLWIFTAALPGKLATLYPHIEALTAAGSETPSVVDGAPPIVAGEQITSLGGQDFVVFAKGPTAYNGGRMVDLYEEVVEPYFEEPFAWETWQVGRNNDLPSGCGGSKSEFLSYTIASVSIPEADPAVDPSMPGNTWGVNHDHSKWGVPYSVGTAVLYKTACVGDINRQSSQAVRGGGTVCFENNNAVFESFRKLLADVETCTQTQVAPPPAKGRKTVKKIAATGKFPKNKTEL